MDFNASDLMDTQTQMALRANPANAYRENGPGVMYSMATRLIYNPTSPIQFAKPKDMVAFLQQRIGVASAGVSRAMAIWTVELEKYTRFCTTVFGDHAKLITSIDMKKILDIDTSEWSHFLRLLFFPTAVDAENDDLASKAFSVPAIYQAGEATLPQMLPYRIKTKEFSNRRPEFLEVLPDNVFEQLKNNPEMECPTWDSWAKATKYISEPMRRILKHIIFWYNPNFKYHAPAAKELKKFSWVDTIVSEVLIKSELCAGGERTYTEEDDFETVASAFLEEIWDLIPTNPAWHDKTLAIMNDKDPNHKLAYITFEDGIMHGDDATLLLADEYLMRFQHPHWTAILQACLAISGPALAGVMTSFNKQNVQEHWDGMMARLRELGVQLADKNFSVNPSDLNENLDRLDLRSQEFNRPTRLAISPYLRVGQRHPKEPQAKRARKTKKTNEKHYPYS
ncbi:hypothetical protein FQN57_005170 [Myotisia sp. PD_48]|nr:hypothetical protein FQN57_005170 [Myotisia sp. PD_48]